jgi:hypothetical protein
MSSKNKRIGSSFQSFLEEEGMVERVRAHAIKRIIAENVRRAMRRRKVTPSLLSKLMQTSRTVVYSLLDSKEGTTLDTLIRASDVLDVPLVNLVKATPAARRPTPKRSRKVARRTTLAAQEARQASHQGDSRRPRRAPDFLDEMIGQRTRRNPRFLELVDEAERLRSGPAKGSKEAAHLKAREE